MSLDAIEHEADTLAAAAAHAMRQVEAQERIELICRMLIVHARKDVVATLAAVDAVVAALRDRLPEPVFAGGAPHFAGQRAECEAWAEFASDGQIAAMLAACLDRIAGTQLLVKDRKRLLVACWNSLTPDDRKAFRDRVMPKDPL